MLSTLYSIPIFLVLLVSFTISFWCARANRAPRVERYLFSGNTPFLAFSSCVGSIVSMAISFTALVSSGFAFGWQIIAPLVLGSIFGLAALLRLSRSNNLLSRETAIAADAHPDGASYLAVFASTQGSFISFSLLFLVFYLAMLTTELAVLRVFLSFLLHIPRPELFLLIFMITFVCCAYVFIGGFRAVLVTDYFQLMVIIAFLGLLLANFKFGLFRGLPAATSARIAWTPASLVVLHLGVFSGAFAWTFANLDQWYRTLGTLRVASARRVLIQAVATLCVFTIVPVLIGSHALSSTAIPPGITNEISLILVHHIFQSGNTTLRFMLMMALVCATLTTLTTYIMTIQQLYYELSIRLDSRSHFQYIIEYLAKWRQVRAVGLIAALICFIGSFWVSSERIYAFGVLALCGFIFAVPWLASVTANRHNEGKMLSRLSANASLGLALSVILFLPLLLFLRWKIGPISLHLYIIPAAASIAACLSSFIALFFGGGRRAYEKA